METTLPSFPARLRAAWSAPRSPQALVLLLSAWLATVGNAALWLALWRTPGPVPPFAEALVMALLVFSLTLALLSLTAWPRWTKPLWIAVLLVAGVAQHYMLAFGIVVDASMIGNLVQTDVREARDVLSWALLGNALLVAAPAVWLLRVPVAARSGARGQVLRTGGLLVAALLLAVATAAAGYHRLAPFMRNNTQLRYMLNPVSTISAATVYGLKPLFKRDKGLVRTSEGAKLGASYAAQQRPPLLLLVVGETARGDHFGLNGYARDTTPELGTRGVVSYGNVRSCGTNTLASVPCMFSPLGKKGFESRRMEHENLLDVLQAAGLAVLWLDNQSGCKGVCARIPQAQAADKLPDALARRLCDGDECLDEAMLYGLDARIAELDPQRRARGVVVVMHQMGSHGPAYYKRSSQRAKRFMPECATADIAKCPLDQVVNAYDNSLAETDLFLGHTIDWLASQQAAFDTALVYISDHGESLGEYGLYLHGLPYSLAPDAQKHVAWITWYSQSMQARAKLDPACLQGHRNAALTHDNLYHSMLGLLDVSSPSYKPALDAQASCRGGAAMALLR